MPSRESHDHVPGGPKGRETRLRFPTYHRPEAPELTQFLESDVLPRVPVTKVIEGVFFEDKDVDVRVNHRMGFIPRYYVVKGITPAGIIYYQATPEWTEEYAFLRCDTDNCRATIEFS